MVIDFLKFATFRTDNMGRAIAFISWLTVLWLLTVAGAIGEELPKMHERDYQQIWCAEHGGKVEHRLRDATRVDCIAVIDTVRYAIEFDFAKKWAEAIGQALYYARMTDRQPGIVLIVEDFDRDMKHINKLTYAIQDEGVRLWLTTR